MKHTHPQLFLIAFAVMGVLVFSLFFIAYFSRELLEGRLLAPGDGYIFHYPAFSLPWKIWEPNILAGYPLFADPQFQLWYPLRWFMPDFNAFIISAYVTAASLTGGYLYWKTHSALAAAAAGLVYAFGSFMLAHLGHVAIIHAAAWLPLLIWAIDGAGVERRWIWFASGASGVALCALGGHPQVLMLSLLLGGYLALSHVLRVARMTSSEAMKLSIFYAAMVLTGVALAAVQLLPFLQLSQLAHRSSSWGFFDFASYSLMLNEIATILLPYIFGGHELGETWPSTPYFGTWGMVETAAYAGAGTIILGAGAVISRRSGDGALFWFSAFLLAILLATSGDNGLGQFLVDVPVFGKFRAQGRAAMLITFSAAVLCGMGVASLQNGRLCRTTACLSALIVMVLAFLAISLTMASSHWQSGLKAASGNLWPSAVVMILPSILLLMAMAALVIWWTRLSPRLSGILLLLLLIVDVGQFGWLRQWANGPLRQQLDPQWKLLSQEIRNGGGRLLSLVGGARSETPASPNLNLLYDLPMAGGYGPLMPRIFYVATGIDASGFPAGTISKTKLALLGISHIAVGGTSTRSLQLGNCDPIATDQIMKVSLAKPIEATSLRITSHMGCSAHRKDGDLVLEIGLHGPDGRETVNMLAGRDTSEWAYDRPDVLRDIQHRRAQIHRSFDGGGFQGHAYSALFDISTDGAVRSITEIELVFPSGGPGGLTLESMEFINGSNGAVEPLNLDLLRLSGLGRFAMLSDGVQLARNAIDGNPLAWLVDQLVPLALPDAEAALLSESLPDGSSLDPRRQAIVDPGIEGLAGLGPGTVTGDVQSQYDEDGRWSLRVQASRPALLVVSQSFYPGWMVEVNGSRVPILRANGAFQAVKVPSGESEVKLWFDPLLLKIGMAITVLTVLGLTASLPALAMWRRSRRLAKYNESH